MGQFICLPVQRALHSREMLQSHVAVTDQLRVLVEVQSFHSFISTFIPGCPFLQHFWNLSNLLISGIWVAITEPIYSLFKFSTRYHLKFSEINSGVVYHKSVNIQGHTTP